MALTAEQQIERRGRITSSRAAACIGLDKYKTPLRVALEIRGEIDKNYTETKATERGNKLEDLVLDYPLDCYPRLTRQDPAYVVHPSGWMGDHADALYYQDGQPFAVGEAKTAALRPARDYGAENTDEVPDNVLIQDHFHLIHHTDFDLCISPVMVGGYQFELRNYRVLRDPDFTPGLEQDLLEFYERYILGDELPPPQPDDYDTIGAWKPDMPKDSGRWFEDNEQIQELIVRAWEARKAVKEAEQLKKSYYARLANMLADYEGCQSAAANVYYRSGKSTTKLDEKALLKYLLDRMPEGMRRAAELQFTRTTQRNRSLYIPPKLKEGFNP